MVSVPARREAVGFVRKRGVSERRACSLMGIARSSLRYESRLETKDGPVLARMRELAEQYPRYGYRRIQVFLARDGMAMGPGRAYRLWNAAKLQVPTKHPRKRVASGRPVRPSYSPGPRVGVRLRPRHVSGWQEAEVSDRGRRVHQRGARHRGCRQYQIESSHPGSRTVCEPPWRPAISAFGQRS
jgi:hypothetical protein